MDQNVQCYTKCHRITCDQCSSEMVTLNCISQPSPAVPLISGHVINQASSRLLCRDCRIQMSLDLYRPLLFTGVVSTSGEVIITHRSSLEALGLYQYWRRKYLRVLSVAHALSKDLKDDDCCSWMSPVFRSRVSSVNFVANRACPYFAFQVLHNHGYYFPNITQGSFPEVLSFLNILTANGSMKEAKGGVNLAQFSMAW